ncbi:TauD/TfdA dioxygenase family protein [Streptomyces sp. NPDC058623]|uniref:(3R)-3-[(carboxymethyl)amino]fatty acid oxygenase/decarboxylase n=1 Tax=Streptomyces sp. NPDC058623 TaxID=3346563 RepID=UPI003658D5C5
MGVTVTGFDAATASHEDFQELKKLVHTEKIVVLKGQRLSPAAFADLGRALGTVETYYQAMYQHHEVPEVFVSSNVPKEGKQVGVPKTGKFWHADYEFMPNPFGLTLIYPQVIPKGNRGTYFIDMAKAYEKLPQELKDAVEGTSTRHSVKRYFKIRPSDVYRPISEVFAEIEEETPTVTHPTVITHPVTGERILYLSEGFGIDMLDADGNVIGDELLNRVLEATGQLDETCGHENIHLQSFEEGDLLVWDNRTLIHRALHTTRPEPTESFRVTVHDDHPFYEGIAA